MGLVRYGIGIAEISGSAGGMVFARNKSGAYIRNRTKPVNPKSPRQEAIRAILSFLAEYWHTNLTAVQRGLWETYAAAVPMKNKLGETIHLSGFNHWMRSNGAQMSTGSALREAAPTVLSLPEKDTELTCSEENIAAQTFTLLCDDAGWAANGDEKNFLMVYQGQPQLVSRVTYHGPFRYAGWCTPPDGALGTFIIDAAYSFAEGQKVWFRARVMTMSGRLSEPWQLDPRTIIADP